MTAAALLATLRAEGVALAIEGDDLLVDGPDTALTDEVVSELKARKPEIIHHLRRASAPLRLVLVRHHHRCRCGREFDCTAPSCAGREIACVCCKVDRIGDRRRGAAR